MDDQVVNFAETVYETVSLYSMDVLGALVLLIVGWIVAGWARSMTLRLMGRTERLDKTIRPLIANGVKYTILAFVLVAVLAKFGVQTTSLIAALGALGLAIGLSLQGTLSNVAAGVMLLILRPFHVGEYIDADGTAGTVEEIGLFTSRLCTFDGVFLSVPNSQLWGRPIKNYTRNPTRRIDVPVGIAYDDDIGVASDALMAVLTGDERIQGDPAPQVMVTSLGDSSVNLNMRCWVKKEDYWGTLFDLNRRGKEAVEAAGCTIPFPQRDVHIIGESQSGQ